LEALILLIFFTAILILSAVLIYPLSWSDMTISHVCKSSKYYTGNCEVKWSYILAMIQSFSSILISLMAFFLASKTELNLDYYNKFLDYQMASKALNFINYGGSNSGCGETTTSPSIQVKEDFHQLSHPTQYQQIPNFLNHQSYGFSFYSS